MFKVYWTDPEGQSKGREFVEMTEALSFTQMLRNELKRKFVSMVSENPDNMTKMGVADVDPDYAWKKRR